MEIIEMANAIGLRILNTPEGQRYERAKKAYEGNVTVNNALMEYQVQQKIMEEQKDSENLDVRLVENVNERIDALYKEITENPDYIEYENAQTALNQIIRNVNQTIINAITGEKPSSCTHDCSTCGGCH